VSLSRRRPEGDNQRVSEGTTMNHAIGTADRARSDSQFDQEPALVEVRELMTSREVAALLKVSAATLSRWRDKGTGPRVLWLSARVPRYAWHDVRHWMDEIRS
jgi:hypothetical protein